MTQQSTDMAAQQEEAIPLPAYMLRQADGIYVILAIFPMGGGFASFIDSLFANGARFKGLDYQMLMGLLYEFDSVVEKHGVASKVKLAEDVVAFPPRRRALYKAVKIDTKNRYAAYFFEPAEITVVTEEPVYGEPDADGVAPIIGSERKEEMQPTTLDLDEFVADMWLKGVRFGIDVDAVAGVIERGDSVRLDIASEVEASEGSDAQIEEACSVLHRDNSPKLLLNGQADLRRFQNRFPQIAKGERLLKKKPRVLGKPGHKVNGAVIEPKMPRDNINLNALAGPGTYVETQDGNEYILSNRDGFLSLDVMTNNISVTEKIENKGGISLKTTGDLSLAGNEFIEHGEVQEGRVVEGKNMTFRSDVYGEVISQGGFILLEKNISSGRAISRGGDVTSNGRAFNSVIEAWDGLVTLKYAESCVILGGTVVVERAVNCEIIGENVQIGSAEGCGIAGKNIKIKSSSACRSKETLVSMLLPDLSAFDAQLVQLSTAIADCNSQVASKDEALALLKSDPEFAKYLALAANIRQGKIQLNASQQEGWKKMSARFAGSMSAGSKLSAEKKDQLGRVQAFVQEQQHLNEAREKASAGVLCEIEEVAGDTIVRGMVAQLSEFRASKPSEIKSRLREQSAQHKRIFSDDIGSVSWSFDVTSEAA